MKKRYNVLSPDGFSIHHEDTYGSIEEAKDAMHKWMKRYEGQGYYSFGWERIPLAVLPSFCKIVKVTT